MKKRLSLTLEHKQCHSCKHWECAKELGSFCSNKLVKTKNIMGNCKQYKQDKLTTFIRFYKTTNCIFASLILEDKKVTVEIRLKKGYKTEAKAKKALENVGKRMGLLVRV